MEHQKTLNLLNETSYSWFGGKKQNKNGTLPTMIKIKYDKGNSVIYKT